MYSKGDRVKHPARPQWGIGEIREVLPDSKVKVFFVNDGEKTLSLKELKLIQVEGPDAAHPLLDNPQPQKSLKSRRTQKKKTNANKRFNNLQGAIGYFLRLFPEGFDGKEFLDNERNYKIAERDLLLSLLNENDLSSLLKADNHAEICKRARQVTNKTNLIFKTERASFNDGLKSADNQMEFSGTLFDLLYGKGELEHRFSALADCLQRIGAAKWPVASYFLFMRYSDEHMFLKPRSAQRLADVCNFELNYHPDPNWLTYKSLLEFARYLYEALKADGLNPRDLIDVQSFIWCVDDNAYQKKQVKEAQVLSGE